VRAKPFSNHHFQVPQCGRRPRCFSGTRESLTSYSQAHIHPMWETHRTRITSPHSGTARGSLQNVFIGINLICSTLVTSHEPTVNWGVHCSLVNQWQNLSVNLSLPTLSPMCLPSIASPSLAILAGTYRYLFTWLLPFFPRRLPSTRSRIMGFWFRHNPDSFQQTWHRAAVKSRDLSQANLGLNAVCSSLHILLALHIFEFYIQKKITPVL
jgi:hypothetical protein